jgi:hypothetical protein
MKNLFLTVASLQAKSVPTAVGFQPQPNTWVQLRDRISPHSFDQALLLCEESNQQWVAWIPDFGEAVLSRHQFYSLD